jgi:hypothetical protein
MTQDLLLVTEHIIRLAERARKAPPLSPSGDLHPDRAALLQLVRTDAFDAILRSLKPVVEAKGHT